MTENNGLPPGWVWLKLEDVIDIRYGYSFRSKDYQEDGILLVRQSNIGGKKVTLNKAVYLPEEFLDSHSDFIVEKGDIVCTQMGEEHAILEILETPYTQVWIECNLRGQKRRGHLHRGEDD